MKILYFVEKVYSYDVFLLKYIFYLSFNNGLIPCALSIMKFTRVEHHGLFALPIINICKALKIALYTLKYFT